MKETLKKIFHMAEKDNKIQEEEVLNEQTPATETATEMGTEENGDFEELKQQLEESRNKYLYLYSDFENFKRHAAKERMELIQTAGRDILSALLPILDDFDRAEKNDALTEGTSLIHQKLVNLLKSKGLVALGTKAGDEFNADLHEAVAEVPAPDDAMKGRIVDILEPGYTLADRIIRYAKVVVGK
ncbi:MAG: nucleotide exchange factor GrpE [Saprospiraceae bacterium]|nr:nucleotide exchange factor GrpE [Saprospiraceae bacterium]